MEIHDVDEESIPQSSKQLTRQTRKMGFWSRTIFQRIFLQSLIRLIIYLHKVYQDFGAVNIYFYENELYFISLLCLILPSLVFAIYQSIKEFVKNGKFNAIEIITKFIHGLLLMPWQIKRHLDGLYFSSQNICSFRTARENEKENILNLERNAEILEFFEDFYAGFIQVVMQLYILSLETNNKYYLIIGELIGSAMSICSMLIAIRRRDDGILTSPLSFGGWISMFTSRVIVIALATTLIKHWIIPLCMIHVIGFTAWVYRIAMKSFEKNRESSSESTNRTNHQKKSGLHMLVLIFFFFGLPSLVMWPYMFDLKEKQRPVKFLIIILLENITIVLIWYFLSSTDEKMKMNWFIAVIVTTLIATLFLSLYFYFKPSKVDKVVLYNMRFNDDFSYGIYFEFCDLVFNLEVEKEIRTALENMREQQSI